MLTRTTTVELLGIQVQKNAQPLLDSGRKLSKDKTRQQNVSKVEPFFIQSVVRIMLQVGVAYVQKKQVLLSNWQNSLSQSTVKKELLFGCQNPKHW